jgi:nucleoside-diphosphate-sugar epimerase
VRVLFVGGTGVISSACARLAVERGTDLTLLHIGDSWREVPEGAEQVIADIRDPQSVRKALGKREFDVVVNWVAFTPEHIQIDIDLFGERTGQYVFISSTSAYQTPPARLPIRESTPLRNPYWLYSRNKIACEEVLLTAYRDRGLPVTIVRPGHTYDRSVVPFEGGWTIVERMRQGKEVVVHGDGSALWPLLHHADFARGFLPLLGDGRTFGEAFHITSDVVQSWDQIAHILARAAGTEARIVHVPSDVIAVEHQEWGDHILGDKTHSQIFDTSKLRSVVPGFVPTIPFEQGAREIVAWYDADPARKVVDSHYDTLMDDLVTRFRVGGREAA